MILVPLVLSAPAEQSPEAIVRVLTAYAEEFAFQKIERQGDYLDRLGKTLSGYRRCPDWTVKRVCETIIVPTPETPDPYGFEKGLICGLWLLLLYQPAYASVLDARTFRTLHGDILPPIISGRPRYAYDYPWTYRREKWRLTPFRTAMDPMGLAPIAFYRRFSELPPRTSPRVDDACSGRDESKEIHTSSFPILWRRTRAKGTERAR